MILRFPSIAALADAYESLGCNRLSNGGAWFNNESIEETLRKTRYGDTTLVSRAEAELAKLDNIIETPRLQWSPAPAGAFCSVPDVIAGLPTPMRRQIHVPDEKAPITILVDVGSSAFFTAEALRNRGVTILALVMALARVRPVTLYQLDVASGHKDKETILITPINTTPLDLATACYVLTSSGFSRGIVMPVEEKLNGNSGGWPPGYYEGSYDKWYLDRADKIGFDPKHTLIVPASRMSDELIAHPLAWINKQIAKFTKDVEELETNG